MILEHLSEAIIGCYYEVYNSLGHGFLEKVYENAMVVELRDKDLLVQQQKPMSVTYRGVIVGDYQADILVNDLVVLELKVTDSRHQSHEAQLINYLKASSKPLGLLLYFGKNAIIRRVVNTSKSV